MGQLARFSCCVCLYLQRQCMQGLKNYCSATATCRRNLAAAFRSHIINSREADNIANLTPVRVLGSCSFMYMRHGDVYILGVTKSNANVMMAFQFMTNVRPALFLPCCMTCTVIGRLCVDIALITPLVHACRWLRCSSPTLGASSASRA